MSRATICDLCKRVCGKYETLIHYLDIGSGMSESPSVINIDLCQDCWEGGVEREPILKLLSKEEGKEAPDA